MKSFVIGLLIASMTASPVMAQCGTYYRSYSSYSPSSYRSYSTYSAPSYTYVEPAKAKVEYVYQAIIPVFQLEVRAQKTYGAVYLPPTPDPVAPGNPPTPQSPGSTQNNDLKQILDALSQISTGIKNLESRVKTLEDKEKAPKPKPKDPFNPDKEEERGGKAKEETKVKPIPDVNVVAKNNCAACHDAKQGEGVAAEITITKDDKLIDMGYKNRTRTLVKLAKAKLCSGAEQKGFKPLTLEEYTSFVTALGRKD